MGRKGRECGASELTEGHGGVESRREEGWRLWLRRVIGSGFRGDCITVVGLQFLQQFLL